MSLNPFSWVRAAFRSAALAGIEDALQHLAATTDAIDAICDRGRDLPQIPDEPESEPKEAEPKRKAK